LIENKKYRSYKKMTPEPITKKVAIKAFKKIFSEVYGLLEKSTKKKFTEWDNEVAIDKLFTNILDVRKVKTLWKHDETIDLNTFYCDPHIVVGENRKKAQNVDDILVKNYIL
jgi:hypothetical protein